jgi:hypothetical protein
MKKFIRFFCKAIIFILVMAPPILGSIPEIKHTFPQA